MLVGLVIFSTPDLSTLKAYIDIFKELTLSIGIVAIIIAYMIGNVIDNFGSWLYYKIGCKIWGEPEPKGNLTRLTHGQQRALVRQYSLENSNILQTWKILKNMSHNLSFAVFLLATVSAIRYFQHYTYDWAILLSVTLISGIVFLKRASIYDKWYYAQMLETVEVLELEKRVKNDVGKSKRSVR